MLNTKRAILPILLILCCFMPSHATRNPLVFYMASRQCLVNPSSSPIIQRYITCNSEAPEQHAKICSSKKNEWQWIRNDLLCTSYRNIGLIFCLTAPLAAAQIALSIPFDITPDPDAIYLCTGATGFTTVLHTPLIAGAGGAHIISKWYESREKKLKRLK